MKEKESASRRRGKTLEIAILKAAWDELQETGYNHITMDNVAVRACTNKAAVYRRWDKKAKLVSAALKEFVPPPLAKIPNSGNLRKDLLILLNSIAKTLQMIGAETVHGLMAEHFNENEPKGLPQLSRDKLNSSAMEILEPILNNAQQRGEIDADKIIPRVKSLPFDLLRHEILVAQTINWKRTILEIVDDIFLPLVRKIYR